MDEKISWNIINQVSIQMLAPTYILVFKVDSFGKRRLNDPKYPTMKKGYL